MDLFASLLLMLAHQLFLTRQEVSALKILRLDVPPYIRRGQTAHLECSYDLESDALYSVTWYKDTEEFYKYEMNGRQSNKIGHSVVGVKLNSGASDDHKVILENVNLNTTGHYKCEVTGDDNHLRFPSVQKEKYMQVVVLPKASPRITGEEKIYANGDILTLNCSSDKSQPAAIITWFINGIQVEPGNVTQIKHQDLLSTVSSLSLELGPDHISSGRLDIKCQSIVATSDRIDDPLDSRFTQVFVQGNGSMTSPNTWLLALLLLHRIALLLR